MKCRLSMVVVSAAVCLVWLAGCSGDEQSPEVANVEYTRAASRTTGPSTITPAPAEPTPRERAEIQELVQLIHGLEPWRDSGAYREVHWARVIDTAREFQRAEPEMVASALRNFAHDATGQRTSGRGYNAASRAMLLLRVMFDLPEDTAAASYVSFGGWIGRPDDGSIGVNYAWPMTWNYGHPVLIAPYQGMLGRTYDPRAEYAWFRRAGFPLRDLENAMLTEAELLEFEEMAELEAAEAVVVVDDADTMMADE